MEFHYTDLGVQEHLLDGECFVPIIGKLIRQFLLLRFI